MMDGYVYLVIEQYIDDCGLKGNIASVQKVPRCYNLVSVFERWKGLISVNACKTLKEAKKTADSWNEAYRNNGTYLFSKEVA